MGKDIDSCPKVPDSKAYFDILIKFDNWYNEEYNKLYENGRLKRNSWLYEIITEKKKCPRKIVIKDGEPFMPENDGYFSSSNWYPPEKINTQRFHTKAEYEMRSKPTKNGHANQCIYNCRGILLTSLSSDDASPGSAVFSSNNLDKGKHLWNDLVPFIWAAQLDGNAVTLMNGKVDKVGVYIRKYYNVRPILYNK